MPGVSVDVTTMKIVDLKKELKARGLSVDGKKNELQDRLKEALDGEVVEEADAEIDEETEKEVLEGKGTEVEKKSPKKRVSISTDAPQVKIFKKDEEATDEEKATAETDEVKTPQEKRAERFGMPMSAEAKKAARAARFGIVDPAEKKAARAARFGTTEKTAKANVNKKLAPADIEQLKARAERFGEISSKTLKKVSLLEKKKERAERFKNGAAKVSETKVESEEAVTSTKTPITAE